MKKRLRKYYGQPLKTVSIFFDMASSEAKPFAAYGPAVSGNQNVWMDHNLDTVKRSVDWQLKAFQTDYIDFGFIYCIADREDLCMVCHMGLSSNTLDLSKAGDRRAKNHYEKLKVKAYACSR